MVLALRENNLKEPFMTDQPKPNFYAIIPAHVRYCKELEMGARLLYGEITALASIEGYSWATNRYFAELYDVDESTIKRWLNSLKDHGFIKTEVENNKFKTTRKIWLSQEIQKMFTKGQKCTPGGSEMNGGGFKNEPHINTSNITYEKEGDIGACAPAPELFICDQVKMQKSRHEELCEKHSASKVDEYIQRLNEYSQMKPKKFKEYGCHATVIENWIRKDEKEKPRIQVKSLDQLNENVKLAKAIEVKFPEHVETMRDHIEFKTGPIQREFLKYNENGFRDQCFNILRKMNITPHGI